MGKPEIIGYQTDPNATREEQEHAELYEYGIDGGELYLRRNGSDVKHYKQSEDWDVWMRWLGMKRVYKPREFHAKPAHGGYRILCKTCGTTTLTSGYLPHDSAKMHAEREHHHSTTWS
jgi:hypothetical protein